jgi:membrane associated rhomboid family serine protease
VEFGWDSRLSSLPPLVSLLGLSKALHTTLSVPSFAGAPLTKGPLPLPFSPSSTRIADLPSTHTALLITVTLTSILAAVTSTQQYLNVPLVPHILRDRQIWRFFTSHLAFTNSSELFLAVLILWYSSAGVERIWGTRKLAVRALRVFTVLCEGKC